MTAAIVADDLTGALDAAAPFAAQGLRTAVATDVSFLDQAMATEAAVVAVNTRSRGLAPAAAAERVFDATRRLNANAPSIVFKKVDSRLKGPIAAEIAAALAGFGCDGAVLCPAIAEFGRFITNAVLHGAGIEAPIPIRALCPDLRIAIADADSADALSALAMELTGASERRLAVGARGLAGALAERMSVGGRADARLRLPRPILIGIGSTDPITRTQVEFLAPLLDPGDVVAAPNGVAAHDRPPGDVVLMFTTAAGRPEPADVVARRFAESVAKAVRTRAPASLILSGGETAEAVLRALGHGALLVEGEVEPGAALARAPDGAMKIITKSGGFGDPQTLARLAEAPLTSNSPGAIDA